MISTPHNNVKIFPPFLIGTHYGYDLLTRYQPLKNPNKKLCVFTDTNCVVCLRRMGGFGIKKGNTH